MQNTIHLVKETIENHLGDLCTIAYESINEALELMGDDVSATAIDEAFTEVLGESPDWDDALLDDLSTLLAEAAVSAAK